jgi:hypothetical protein
MITTTYFKFLISILLVGMAFGGPIMAGSAVAGCYTACNAGYVCCMTSAGLVAGLTGPVGWCMMAGAASTCSSIQGTCMATCVTTGLAMTVAPAPWKHSSRTETTNHLFLSTSKRYNWSDNCTVVWR